MSQLSQRVELTLTVKDLTYWVPDGNKGQRSILKGISGCFPSGQLTAILGPSGAGKTTFMNIAAGYRTRRVSGNILVNGKPRDLAQFRRHSCYITQADHLLAFLTVSEAMRFAATLKLGDRASTEGEAVIDDILQRLRLTECRDTRTHDLSGGETKRLSIALELVNNPPIMFFDEPTSGLDSRNSLECVQLLQSLARGGRAIVCTVHQPSARLFQLFDQLYALADGQCIYRGTTTELLPFLDSMGLRCPPYHNPADFLVEVAVGEYGDLTRRLAAEMGWKNMVPPAHDGSLDVVPDEDLLQQENSRNCGSLCGSPGHKEQEGIQMIGSSSPSLNPRTALDSKGSCQDNGDLHPSSPDRSIKLSTFTVSTGPSEPPEDPGSGSDTGSPGTCVYSATETKITIQPTPQQALLDSNTNSSMTTGPSFQSSFWVQFVVLFKRTFLTIIRDLMLTKLRLGAHIVVALMIGLLYYGVGAEASKVMDNTGCLFFIVLFFLFTAMMPTILTFPLEMNVLVREHLNRWYSLKSYYLARVVADLPFQILFPLMSVLIVYYLTAQPFEFWRVCLFTFFCILTSLVAQSIGLTIGAAFTVQEAVFLGPASVVPMLLFSGFFIHLSTIPVYMRWITYLSFVRYGFEGVVLSIYGFGRSNLECSEAFCYLKAPSKILETLDVEEVNIYLDAGLLVVYFIVVRVMGYYILRWKVRKNR